jgi:epoxyqueuosine reductase
MDFEKTELTRNIKNEARRLGFDMVGVTTPAPPPHLDVYRRWLDQGRHGEMAYLARESAIRRRSDPLEILPECKSILVTGLNYLPSGMDAKTSSPHIAAYALGEDYHDVLSTRLKELAHFIHRLVGSIPSRIYIDTGPVLEKELAQRSGLGWIGKNTCLINPRMGSYFFLGELLLGIDLEIDTPFEEDRCGSCTRCIDACPTGCILPDRTLDAQRCISYLTIELKSAIPRDLRSLIGDWAFGCDICQQVCPWNIRFGQTSNESAFQPNPFLLERSIPSLLSLSQEDFRTHLRKSPLKRSKWTGILRNSIIVAGNHGGMEAAPLLANLLMDHPNSMVRSHAAWALGRIGEYKLRNILEKAKESEEDPTVREEIAFAIQSCKKSANSA